MAGAEFEHPVIVNNIDFALKTASGERPCNSLTQDQRVKAAEAEMYTYPDVVAFCGEGQFDRSSRPAMLLNPQVIFEVLSPSTEAFDRNDKFRRYQTLPSLTDYILVASDCLRVEHFTRQPDDSWPGKAFDQPTDGLSLRSMEVGLTLAQIYRRVAFPA